MLTPRSIGARLVAPELMGYGPGESWASGTPVSLEAEARRLAPLLSAVAERMHKVRAEFEALFADTVPAWSYRTLEMPVRLITASTSPLPARKVVDLIARQCAQAEVVRLEGVGHMGPLSHASMVAPHLAFQPREAPLALAA